MATVGFIFPGQGSQTVGMGKSIYENSLVAKAIYDRASSIIDVDVKHISFDGSEDTLKKTENTQPCLFTIGIALHEMLKIELDKKNIEYKYYGGHSLGEVTALSAAGKFSFDDGLNIACKRGAIMSAAGEENAYLMAAVIGLDYNTVKEACSKAGCSEGDVVLANYNSAEQMVVSGKREAVEGLCKYFKENGAKMVVELKVSGAFHSPFMKEASDKFEAVLSEYVIHNNENKVISNVIGDFYNADNIKELLVKQMYSEVNWLGCVKALENAGVDTLFELGPGRVLAGLIKKIAPNIKVYNVYDMDTFSKALENL